MTKWGVMSWSELNEVLLSKGSQSPGRRRGRVKEEKKEEKKEEEMI